MAGLFVSVQFLKGDYKRTKYYLPFYIFSVCLLLKEKILSTAVYATEPLDVCAELWKPGAAISLIIIVVLHQTRTF